MNWINKILNRKSNQNSNGNPMNSFDNSMYEVNVPQELFIDEKEPGIKEETTTKNKSSLTLFLEADHYEKGYSDGYLYHATEMMTHGIKSIKARFRMEADQSIQVKKALLLHTENELIDAEGVSDRIERKYQGIIKNLNEQIDRLEQEKTLSAEDEGLVMIAIHPYKEGFIRGLEKYHFENNIGLSTGLFNY